MELSFISRVIKTNFLNFLVLKDKNPWVFFQENPAGFFIFHLFQVFHFSPFSGVLCCCTESSSLKVTGPLTEAGNTDLFHLFV